MIVKLWAVVAACLFLVVATLFFKSFLPTVLLILALGVIFSIASKLDTTKQD